MADRLISADALKRKLCRRKNSITDTYGKNDAWAICLNEVLERIDNAPTIEAEPIKHGRWIEEGLVDGNQNRYCKCSECGKGDTQAISQRVPYCWWCGARMDEMEERKESDVYCDRNLCVQNEYNGIECDECEVRK